MRKFAEEISNLVHALGKMDVLAVKVASETACMEAQQTCAQAAYGIYDVMQKRAQEECDGDMCTLVEKMAYALGKPGVVTPVFKAKLASAIAVDTALSKQPAPPKTAALRAYGREYVTELLREVL